MSSSAVPPSSKDDNGRGNTNPAELTPSSNHKTDSLEHCIRARHSVREYLPDPVDTSLIQDCLRLAQLAPSNSNIQNWRLFLATGPARERIVKKLMAAATSGADPDIPPLPEKYKHFRSELGKQVYGDHGYGIPREDKERHAKAVLRNYEFFGAPVIAVVAQDPSLSQADTLSVGMWLQTFILALTEQGLGTCLEVSVTGYSDVLKEEFGIGKELDIICGMAVGWPDPESKVNHVNIGREEVDENVRWVKE